MFKLLKDHASRKSYLEVKLNQRDVDGFAAAGMLLFRRSAADFVEVLFAREDRPSTGDRLGGDLLNFLGGKRNLKTQSPRAVAVDKVDWETGGVLRRETISHMLKEDACPFALWSPSPKYVLFPYELTHKEDLDVVVRSASVTHAERLEWVPRSSLLSPAFCHADIHTLSSLMIEDLIECNVLGKTNLEVLFDFVAKRAAPASQAADSVAASVGATHGVLPAESDNIATTRAGSAERARTFVAPKVEGSYVAAEAIASSSSNADIDSLAQLLSQIKTGGN
jgi:hypothetical protein